MTRIEFRNRIESIICRRSVVSSGYSGFLHQKTDYIIIISPPWYGPGCCWGVKPQYKKKSIPVLGLDSCSNIKNANVKLKIARLDRLAPPRNFYPPPLTPPPPLAIRHCMHITSSCIIAPREDRRAQLPHAPEAKRALNGKIKQMIVCMYTSMFALCV